MTESDPFSLDSYDYVLPEERIAQHPPEVRGTSRLMILDRTERFPKTAFSTDCRIFFRNVPCLWQTIPGGSCRLFGKKPSGGKAEMLLLTPPVLLGEAGLSRPRQFFQCGSRGSASPRKKHQGRRCAGFRPASGGSHGKTRFGRHVLRLIWQGSLTAILESVGKLPLPPYIHREQEAEDLSPLPDHVCKKRQEGEAVAAPTAGLHFTEEMRNRLRESGVDWVK